MHPATLHPLPPAWLRPLLRAVNIALFAVAVNSMPAGSPTVGVAILHSAPWSPNAAAREGAGEFEVMLCVAQLQHDHTVAGLLSVGDRNGMRPCGGESALRRAALSGLPVVKLAPLGEVAATPDALFVDGGKLSETHAHQVLKDCLERFGAPPAAIDPGKPTKRELAAIRAHLLLFQQAFANAARTLVAVR